MKGGKGSKAGKSKGKGKSAKATDVCEPSVDLEEAEDAQHSAAMEILPPDSALAATSVSTEPHSMTAMKPL